MSTESGIIKVGTLTPQEGQAERLFLAATEIPRQKYKDEAEMFRSGESLRAVVARLMQASGPGRG